MDTLTKFHYEPTGAAILCDQFLQAHARGKVEPTGVCRRSGQIGYTNVERKSVIECHPVLILGSYYTINRNFSVWKNGHYIVLDLVTGTIRSANSVYTEVQGGTVERYDNKLHRWRQIEIKFVEQTVTLY